MPGYLDNQIDRCIEEGPMKAESASTPEVNGSKRDNDTKNRPFEIWYYHGFLNKSDMEIAGCPCKQDTQIPAMMTMVNNHVIRAALNPLDSGDFPYDVLVWKTIDGRWTGHGVARMGRPAQRIINGATRNLMENAGLAAGGMIVIKQGLVQAADGGPIRIGPRMVFLAGQDADVDDVRSVFTFIEIPMHQAELQAIIQLGMKMMEDLTQLPMLLQGQQGSAPDTVGGLTILNNNANVTRRALARRLDARITEPQVTRYYKWLLYHGKDDEKGDFVIKARGSSALVERDIQNQQIPQLLQVSLNPVFGLDPKKAMQEQLRVWKLNPDAFEYDDEKWQQIVQNMSQPKQDSRIEVEKIKIQGRQQEFAAEQQVKQQTDGQTMQFDAAESAKDRENKIVLAMINERMASAELSALERQTLEKIKATLASDSMKLGTQVNLSEKGMLHDKDVQTANHMVNLHKNALTPPVEPTGRAKTGAAFYE